MRLIALIPHQPYLAEIVVGFWVRSEGYAQRNLSLGTGDRSEEQLLTSVFTERQPVNYQFGSALPAAPRPTLCVVFELSANNIANHTLRIRIAFRRDWEWYSR